MRGPAVLALLLIAGLAGCLDNDSGADPVETTAPVLTDLPALANLTALSGIPMAFVEKVVDAAVQFSNDLYEPTLEVCADGSIYITGHTLLVDTTGAPVFGSSDDGDSWFQLPFFMDQSMPAALHGATPPPSDELFLSCGDDGWLYGVDITLATFPVNAWSGNGTEFAYHNPNAYDDHQVLLQAGDCIAAPAKDRPWGAYSNGTLLMVSNPASGPAQVGVLPVPPGPAGMPAPMPLGLGATAGGGWWNLCAGPNQLPAENNIPGIPDIRADGLFAVPQRAGGTLYLVLGNKAAIMDTELVPLFPHTSGGEITSVYGIAAFDAAGDLFIGISNNTAMDKEETRDGYLRFAVSTDGGRTFADRTFSTGRDQPVVHFYMDANEKGPGALAVWAVAGETEDAEGETAAWDWYVGHVQVGADRLPVLENVQLAIDEGPMPSAHVTGAGVGPDGRAYLAMYENGEPLGNPLSVFVQTDGPTLPVWA